jgi:hypothetical protein
MKPPAPVTSIFRRLAIVFQSRGAAGRIARIALIDSRLNIDVMKRLVSRSMWCINCPHKSYTRSTPQRREASHGPYWH